MIQMILGSNMYDKIFEDKKNEIFHFHHFPELLVRLDIMEVIMMEQIFKWVIKNFLGKITKINKYN